MEKFDKEQNALKYSKDGKDLIDEWAEIDYRIAVIACITKIQGYHRRYNSWAQKAGNSTDIDKSFDYLQRAKAIMMSQVHNAQIYIMLTTLETNIQRQNEGAVEQNCKQILLLIKQTFN